MHNINTMHNARSLL